MKEFNRIKKINGGKYVYRIFPYYDKKKKVTRQHSKYLGVYTGDINAPIMKKNLSVPQRVYSYGEFIPFLSIIDKFNIRNILKECIYDKGDIILSIALNKSIHPLSLRNIKSWFEGTILMKEFGKLALSSQNISRLLEYVGERNIQQSFSQKLIMNITSKKTLFYDITSFSSYSKVLELLEYGHNRDGDRLPQFNLGLVVEREEGIPITYDIYPGSITDVTTLKRTTEKLKILGVEHPLLILDRGFFSQDNLLKLLDDKTTFVIGATTKLKEMEQLFNNTYLEIDSPDYLNKFNDKIIFTKTLQVKIKSKKLRVFFFYDPKRAHEEEITFYSILHTKLEELQQTSFQKKTKPADKFKFITKDFAQFFTYKVVKNRFRVRFQKERIQERIKQLGKFMIVTNTKMTWHEALTYYKGKDIAEKGFFIMKNYFGSLPANVNKEMVLRGLVFVFFIALILEMKLLAKMKQAKLTKKYSIQSLVTELHKLKKIEFENKTLMTSEVTKKQRHLLKALGLCA